MIEFQRWVDLDKGCVAAKVKHYSWGPWAKPVTRRVILVLGQWMYDYEMAELPPKDARIMDKELVKRRDNCATEANG